MKSKNRKLKRNKAIPAVGESLAAESSGNQSPALTTSPSWAVWGTWKRGIASVIIAVYLAVLIIGPLSNPVASENLTAPIAKAVAPLHRALFMGHGYRFFAPNPGDSHLVKYKITKSDGTQIEGMFPDRDTIWPRLLYHRWFMLSETVFAEHAQTPSPDEFKKLLVEKRARAKLLTAGGKLKLAEKLNREAAKEEVAYDKTIKRIKALVRAMGDFLLTRYDGEEIELSVVTRTIPFPAEVRQGSDLGDDVFLRYPANAIIGRFTKSDSTTSDPVSGSDTVQSGDKTEVIE